MPHLTDILPKLRRRAIFAAQVPISEPEMRAYVVILPKVQQPEPTTHNLSPVIEYEVRYLKHHCRFTETHYGYDWDYALKDKATWVKRILVPRTATDEELVAVLSQYLTDLSGFERPHEFDSTLVNSVLDYYLNQPDKMPHLWQDDE